MQNDILNELVCGALHAMVSCGGAAATGASCKTAAGAAVATVALNDLLIGVNTKDMTEAQKLAYSNLIQTIITGAATGMNMDSAAGQLASKMEVENNGVISEINFAIKNPIIANAIGQVKDPKTVKNPNISTITASFQLNLLGDGPEGSKSNAFRHALCKLLSQSNME